MKQLHLSSQKIFDKSFNVDFKGYTPTEVDSFLDLIIQDYENFETELKTLQEKVEHYEQIISEMSQANQTLQGKLSSIQQQDGGNGSMIDLIRRVARLEEIVLKD